MHAIVDLLGDTVISHSGSTSTRKLAGEGRVIGLYFSAHWCPPCRAFTLQLVEWYKSFKAQAARGKDLDIVFVSSDKDEHTFLEYFQSMPWYSLPFTEKDRKDLLSKKFKVQGIPALVFIDGIMGKLITSDGRNCIVEDPQGIDFPWHHKPLSEILSGKFRKQDGEVSCSEALDKKVKGLYFSAHWCPPCRSFTGQLAQTYAALHDRGLNFEVVFVSVDRSQESYNEYYKSMPWLALPLADERVQQLTRHFSVQGIPTLILLDEKNDLITTNGRTVVMKDPEGKEFPWPPKPLDQLNEVTANLLNESTCFVMFTDGEEKMIHEAQDLLQDVAQRYRSEQRSSLGSPHELPPVHFLYEGSEGEQIADSIRSFAHLEDFSPLLAVLDVPSQRAYCHPSDKLSTDVVERLIADFKADKLPFHKLKH